MKKIFPVLALVAVIVRVGAGVLVGQGVEIEKASPTEPPSTPAHAQAPPKPTATPTPTAAEALYDYLQKYHIEVAKDQSESRLIWTDRVLIEIADNSPPEPLASLLAAAPPNNARFASWVHDTFETQLDKWHAGKKNPHPSKPGTDELVSVRGQGRCFVNPVYLAYVLSRYPEAGILIKGQTDPVLFTVNGRLRAVVSPWTKLPDGTPLL